MGVKYFKTRMGYDGPWGVWHAVKGMRNLSPKLERKLALCGYLYIGYIGQNQTEDTADDPPPGGICKKCARSNGTPPALLAEPLFELRKGG